MIGMCQMKKDSNMKPNSLHRLIVFLLTRYYNIETVFEDPCEDKKSNSSVL